MPLLLAPFVGSFLGVLVRRLPRGQPVGLARSACESCGTVLRARELVPLASFLWQRGRCAHCGARIDPFHWWIELAAVAVAALVVAATPESPAMWINCGLGWCLLALGWIDARHHRLPDVLTLPLIPAGLTVTWWLDPWDLQDHAIGAVAGYAAFRLLGLAYRRLRGREGLGQGDAKLLAAAGAWLGWAALPQVIFGAAILAIGALLLSRRPSGRGDAIAFGPFLAMMILAVQLLRADR